MGKGESMLVDLLLREIDELPTFTVLQVGAYSVGDDDSKESYLDFPDRFRGSRVIVCEPDEALCERMNEKREKEEGAEYYPVALGDSSQVCDFYLTEDPAWNSVYRTDQNLLFKYQNMKTLLFGMAEALFMPGVRFRQKCQ